MIDITQGETKIINLSVRDALADAFDLTAYDIYMVCFPLISGDLVISQEANTNGSIVELVGAASLGKLKVTLSFKDTLLLKEGRALDIGFKVDNESAPAPKSQNIAGVLNVYKEVCKVK